MLPPLTHRLLIESPGEAAPFTLAGRECVVHGTERTGIDQVITAGRQLMRACRVSNATCTHFRITPLGIERELNVSGVAVVEKTIVSPNDAACAIEWLAAVDVELEIQLEIVADDVVLEPAMLNQSSRMRLRRGQPQLIVISAMSTHGDAATWVRTHQAASARRDAELLRAEFPDESLNDAVAWALFRLNPRAPLPDSSWPEFTAGKSNEGNHHWQQLAMHCFVDEKGAWPDEPGHSAGDLIAGLVHGMLGLQADPERERLRLRPQLAADLSHARFANLRSGDALVDMEFECAEAGMRFTITQVAGPYPLRLIFEPALTELPRRIEVDGRSAELDLVPLGERVVAPVQIMLDERRTVEFYS